jgi:hypothetical protein
MVHNRCRELDRFFAPGPEIETFHRPREARDVVSALLDDEARRRAIGGAARARVEREHSWDSRLLRMLDAAGFNRDWFAAPASEDVVAG